MIKTMLLNNKYFGNLNPDTETEKMFYEKNLDMSDRVPIKYTYNNLGFRCDDFVKEKSGMHILFGGCSETEGAANHLKDVWAYVLFNKIKKDINVSGYYNVGKAGLTVSTVIMNIFQYIDDYGTPDYIFLQLPDQTRYIAWSEEEGFHPKYQVFGEKIDNLDLDTYFKNHASPEVININMMYNNFLLKSLISFCKSSNVGLLWSSWDAASAKNLTNQFNSLDEYIDTSTLGKEYWDIKIKDLRATDGYHFGRGFHEIWANKFYERFLSDKNNKKYNC